MCQHLMMLKKIKLIYLIDRKSALKYTVSWMSKKDTVVCTTHTFVEEYAS